VFASLKGILDGGIEIPHGEEVVPEEDYLARNVDQAKFNDVKNKIMEG
jgi:hypothetical protein